MSNELAAIQSSAEPMDHLRIITNALEASLTEPMSENWIAFCRALIERSRWILEEAK